MTRSEILNHIDDILWEVTMDMMYENWKHLKVGDISKAVDEELIMVDDITDLFKKRIVRCMEILKEDQ